MLRMIIWADSEQKNIIFKKSKQDVRDLRKNNLEELTVQMDPK